MLQRLPGLGRVRAESDDRQFIDTYILDGLRAVDLLEGIATFAVELERTVWRNPLDQLGQRIFSAGITDGGKTAMQFATRCASSKNRVLAADVISSLVWLDDDEYDFRNFALDDAHFLLLDMSRAVIKNLRITNSTFSSLVFPNEQPSGVFIGDSLVESAYGVTSMKGVPEWATSCSIEKFESAENISRIRQIGLSPGHEVLIAIIRKTFFQKGSGRKEEALVRGLGRVGRSGLSSKVLNLLMTRGILSKFQGDEGWVYTPNREHVARMGKLTAELNLSNDQIWERLGHYPDLNVWNYDRHSVVEPTGISVTRSHGRDGLPGRALATASTAASSTASAEWTYLLVMLCVVWPSKLAIVGSCIRNQRRDSRSCGQGVAA
jgi:hypothetical protein